MTWMRRSWIAIGLVGACAAGIAAQETKLAFEVSSVRPGRDGPIRLGDATPRVLPGGRFEASQVTAEQLLWFAYEGRIKQEYQFAGLPAWMHTDRFVVSAIAAGDTPIDRMRLMVQSLLEDRFRMVTHMEPREMQLEALVLAHPEGRLGIRLFPMQTCRSDAVREFQQEFAEQLRRPSHIPVGTGTGISGCSTEGLNTLASYLTSRLGVPVGDATGLDGPYYYSLPEGLPQQQGSIVGRPLNAPTNPPALSTALKEWLGLKLERRKGIVQVLVIDSIQQPTEN